MGVEWILPLRFAKWVAVLLYVCGAVGTVLTPPLGLRRRFAYRLAGPGFVLTWLAGFLLLSARRYDPLSMWVWASLLLSLLSLQAVLFRAGRAERQGSVSAHLQQSRGGRAKLRERVAVEHTLAHLANRQGARARYRGLRKNVFDLRRMATIQNLEVISRREHRARAA